jgi:glutathione S-transferase
MLAPIRRTRRTGGRRGSRRLRPTRIPTLILDDGEVLVESAAILDALDEMAGPEKRLTPPAGPARRRVLKVTGIAVAAMEKAQWAAYELRFHPEDKVHQPWIEHNEAQALDGLHYLDDLAGEAGADGWLAGTPRMSQADISAAIAYTFAATIRPELGVVEKAPALAQFAARCEALEIFKAAPVPG